MDEFNSTETYILNAERRIQLDFLKARLLINFNHALVRQILAGVGSSYY